MKVDKEVKRRAEEFFVKFRYHYSDIKQCELDVQLFRSVLVQKINDLRKILLKQTDNIGLANEHNYWYDMYYDLNNFEDNVIDFINNYEEFIKKFDKYIKKLRKEDEQ